MISRNKNELWGRVLMDELARCGLEHVIVSPGSRSTPLVLAAATDTRLRVTVQIDERSAGFLALGAGKATGTPAAVVTTSGTAVANLFPAIVEAVQSETPLVVLTADRPPRLRGADANQTLEQRGIFGRYTRLFEELSPGAPSEERLRHLRSVACRGIAAALGDPAGPVHLNIPFDTPLEPTAVQGDLSPELADGSTLGSAGREDGAPWTSLRPMRAAPSAEDLAEVMEALRGAQAPIIVAGLVPRPWEVGPSLRRAASALGVPLLADALSGARYGGKDASDAASLVVGGYEIGLRNAAVQDRLRPDLIVRVGSAPTSSILEQWLESLDGVPHVLVDGGGRWKDHAATCTRLVSADPARFFQALVSALKCPSSSIREGSSWQEVEEDVSAQVHGPLMDLGFEGGVVADIVGRIDSKDVLFVSNSMPVRDLDAFVPGRDRPLMALGNRGASGIDGIVSTAAGVALASGRRVIGIIGDLALLHDSNGLSALREPGVRVLLVVLNNDGGGIFSFLPIREFEPAFTPLFATPQGRDLDTLAALHGLPHACVDLRPEPEGGTSSAMLGDAWAKAVDWRASGILEVRTDREQNRTRRLQALEAISSALGTVTSPEGG